MKFTDASKKHRVFALSLGEVTRPMVTRSQFTMFLWGCLWTILGIAFVAGGTYALRNAPIDF